MKRTITSGNSTSGNSLAKTIWMKIRPGIARHRRNWLFRGVTRTSQLWLKAVENCNGDFATNGEEMVVRSLRAAGLKTVFDVGSNVGDWSLLVERHHPAAHIHAFELSPPTFEKLSANTRNSARIQRYNFGLSDAEGEAEFFHYEDKPGETSLLQIPNQTGAIKLRGSLRVGDRFCAEQGIKQIDLLKIDVEGMESAVLRGFQGMLSEYRISVVQFEYEKLNPCTKFLLKDFYDLFSGYGYRLGKIYPANVEFRDYAFEHELQWGSNFLAVLKDRTDLIERFPA